MSRRMMEAPDPSPAFPAMPCRDPTALMNFPVDDHRVGLSNSPAVVIPLFMGFGRRVKSVFKALFPLLRAISSPVSQRTPAWRRRTLPTRGHGAL
jgi:hypothetical protein